MTRTKLLTVYLAAVAITLVAWVLNVSQLYWMAGVLFLLPYGSKLFAQMERRGLLVTREVPPAAHQGEVVPIRLTAINQGSLPKLHLSVRDVLPAGMEAEDREPLPIHLAPGGQDQVEYQVHLRRRGVHTIAAVRVHSTDLLGLCDQEASLPVSTQILVYPRVVALPPHVMVPELGGGSAPLDSASRKGEGTSFFGIREYRPGDPLRHVHWPTTARRGSLAVVEWEAEESRNALIAVDTEQRHERSLPGGSTLDLAAGLAASLATEILAANNSVRLLVPGSAGQRPMGQRGSEAMPVLLETLARMQGTTDASVAAELRRVAPHLEPGSVVCWLTAAPGDELLATVQYLQAVRLRPVVYALIDSDAGQPSDWDRSARELEGLRTPVIRLHRNDTLVRDLLG
ncbi:MAG: vWA domain-containing protein [Armatimonadetes bacterium]|jgi:uncharacterized protein (DUF58 family)|nr:vWA domain-containing protein [Armatimonadota bacterium]